MIRARDHGLHVCQVTYCARSIVLTSEASAHSCCELGLLELTVLAREIDRAVAFVAVWSIRLEALAVVQAGIAQTLI